MMFVHIIFLDTFPCNTTFAGPDNQWYRRQTPTSTNYTHDQTAIPSGFDMSKDSLGRLSFSGSGISITAGEYKGSRSSLPHR